MYPSNGIQDPSSTNEDFFSSSLLNAFPPSHLVNFNDDAMFFQDFHDILHRRNDDREMDQEMVMVTHEGASNTNMSKIADDMYFNKNSNAKKKKLSCAGSSKLREIKRRCNKDRHSKITTANGSSRGRRMRLSLNVAKEFFTLHDMLGHDKASKTVEWLLKNSENAIKEEITKHVVGKNHSPCPSTSVLSAIDELEPEAATKEGTQKVGAAQPVKKGLRQKARARARERTQEKKRLQLVGGFTDNDRSRLYNCSQGTNIVSDYPLLSCEKSATASNKFYNMSTSDPAPVLEVEGILNYNKQQPHSFEGSTNTEELIIDHSFFVSNNWNPYTVFNFHQNS